MSADRYNSSNVAPLLTPGMVLQRRFVRPKGGPLCDPVMLLDANSSYAHVRHSDGRETTCQRLTTPLVPVLRKTSSFRVISSE